MIQRWVQAIRNRDVETASFEDGAKVQEMPTGFTLTWVKPVGI